MERNNIPGIFIINSVIAYLLHHDSTFSPSDFFTSVRNSYSCPNCSSLILSNNPGSIFFPQPSLGVLKLRTRESFEGAGESAESGAVCSFMVSKYL